MTLTRRTVFVLTAAALALPAHAVGMETWRGYRIDLSAAPAEGREILLTYIRQQIDLIEGLPIAEARKAWFRGVTIVINPALNMAGRFRDGRLELNGETSPADNPVLLHEMLHGYHFEVLKPGGRQDEVVVAWERAKASRKWPRNAYMLENPAEFFAMTCSVALWGKAARPPRTRGNLKMRAPGWYDWIVREFELRV